LRFLIDHALSFRVAELLRSANHDAIHVAEIRLSAAADQVIFDFAHSDDRIIVSADTDFGTLLALQRTPKPSCILLRWPELRNAEQQTRVLLANLSNVSDALGAGAVVVIEPHRVRVRYLPLTEMR
jgi:predicted nuclease of predicted toxin-antitoxin system